MSVPITVCDLSTDEANPAVNDAPALKMADVGISMGKSGTDVAKQAADVILVDDNFATILSAVEEGMCSNPHVLALQLTHDVLSGKTIFHNIRNFLAFQLSTAIAALTLITLSTFLGLSNPLNAMQILFINILMDGETRSYFCDGLSDVRILGPPSQSLGVDPVNPAVMRRPPRDKNEPIISLKLVYRVLFSASMIIAGTLWIFAYTLSDDSMSQRDQTMVRT